MNTVPYWRTTAFEKKIEVFKYNNGTYIANTKLVPRAGKQSAELNADEPSTLYQYVYGKPGSVYEWGVSHRARNDVSSDGRKDTMAVFIGPKQTVDPTKTSKDGQDQFMKTVDWLNEHKIDDLSISGLDYGDCKAFEVFTTKFGEKGTFVDADGNTVEDNDAISMLQDDIHTEKWHVWIIVSSKDYWYDYGVTAAEDCAYYKDGIDTVAERDVTNSSYPEHSFKIRYKKPDYNYTYTVPQTSTEGTIYAYCAYKTASNDSNKHMTIGNFVDNSRMSIPSPVRVTTTEGGSADVSLSTKVSTSDITAKVTAEKQFSMDTAAGNTLSLTIKPGASDEYGTFTFMGAYVNNEWKYASEKCFTSNDDGSYTYTHEVTDGMNSIHLVFAKHPYIIHSPNGGTYQGGTGDKADKIEEPGTIGYSGVPEAGADAKFTYWMVAGCNAKVGAEHTVVVAAGTEAGKYNITVRDEKGTDVATIENTDIIVLIAHYEYPQIVNIYTMEGGRWNLSNSGGTVDITYNGKTETTAGHTTTVYTEDNTTVTLSAHPADNYHLDRMVSDDAVTTGSVFTYPSAGQRVISVYFMTGKIKPILSFVDESGSDSYIFDMNTGEKKSIPDVGDVYGNTVSTAFTAFWVGDENTYRYVQWVINIPFDNETLIKKNPIINDLKGIKVEETAFKTDSSNVNESFRGEIYKCAADNQPRQFIINFPTTITGATSIYSTIILDGIYSPNSTAELRSITKVNANYEGSNLLNDTNGFSISVNAPEDKEKYHNDSKNYYRIPIINKPED